MKIAYIAAGAAGMYCGTCIHDNTLASELIKQEHEVALIPTYTPLRTDEEDVSINRIFFGGINVYLQQKSAIFRHTPWLLDRIFDSSTLLNSVSKLSASTNAKDLGSLTVSMLKGENGKQRKELCKLVQWLKTDYQPDIVQLTNSMFVGMAAEIKREVGVPVVCRFQGEDIFLDDLIEPYKSEAMELLKDKSGDIDGFFASCHYYAGHMAKYTGTPRDQIHVVPLGLNLEGHGEVKRELDSEPFIIGYLARICPEKGLHLLVEAFYQLTQKLGKDKIRLKVAGYLGARDQAYFDQICQQLRNWNIFDTFEYWGEIGREQKIRFLNQIHVLSVPTVYRESKGLFVLESLANGTPVVLPDHGSFPELVQATAGGILVQPLSADATAKGILELIQNQDLCQQLGKNGKQTVHQEFGISRTAKNMLAVFRDYVSS